VAAEDIKDHQFTSKNQPKNRRSRKGVPNRATVYKQMLKLKVDVFDPTGSKVRLSLYEAAALGQIKSAMEGNTRAWIEIQDSLFGKQSVNLGLTAEDIKNLTDAELDNLIAKT
jgi:hypothetical protein